MAENFEAGATILEKGELSLAQKDELWNTLRKTGQHSDSSGGYLKITFLIVEFTMKSDGGKDPVKKLCVVQNGKPNGNKGHSEVLFEKWVQEKKQVPEDANLVIYINYSPCSNCCYDTNEFCEQKPYFKMKFICSQLYYAKRPSCKNRGCHCYRKQEFAQKCMFKNRDLHNDLIKGLRGLNESVTVRPFNADHWEKLYKLLDDYIPLEDRLGAMELAGGKYPPYGRSNDEDEWLLEDFIELKLFDKE